MAVKPRPNPVHIISLGGGVQSTTLAHMATAGIIKPMPAAAVFADTQSESQETYRHLDQLRQELKFPIVTLESGDLARDSTALIEPRAGGKKYVNALIPAFYTMNDKKVMINRRCTRNYKIVPIRRYSRQYFERGVSQWIGISTDEAQRMRDSDVGCVVNRYPLIELGMSRQDCLQWLRDHKKRIPPKSSCYFCPFHSDAHWFDMKRDRPIEFNKAVAYERQMWEANEKSETRYIKPFLHQSRIPLDEVEFRSDGYRDGFGNDCSGTCGV